MNPLAQVMLLKRFGVSVVFEAHGWRFVGLPVAILGVAKVMTRCLRWTRPRLALK